MGGGYTSGNERGYVGSYCTITYDGYNRVEGVLCVTKDYIYATCLDHSSTHVYAIYRCTILYFRAPILSYSDAGYIFNRFEYNSDEALAIYDLMPESWLLAFNQSYPSIQYILQIPLNQ